MLTFDLTQLNRELRGVLAIAHDDAIPAAMRYSMVFHRHKTQVVPALAELGIDLTWNDPDMAYEDDIAAYIQAVQELLPIVDRMCTTVKAVKE